MDNLNPRSMATTTFEDEWSSFLGVSVAIRCTKPGTMDPEQDRKTPLSLSIFLGTSLHENSDVLLQAYCYAVPFRNKEVCISDLVESSNDSTQDILHKVARILVKKYRRPCYVQLADSSRNGSSMATDQVQLVQNIVASIEAH